ncbi:MAG: HAD-IA family hydrolase [Candidatus Saccharimonas sp.]
MIRGIIFDCFGVLYGGSYDALKQLCEPSQLEDLHDFNRQADYGFITSHDYIVGVAKLLDKTEDEISAIFHAKHIRNQPLIDYLMTLKGKYKIALLSNVSNGLIDTLFTSDELETLFDTVVLSYQEHVVKPNPIIFELTATKMELATGECVMIDDLSENCEGAEIAGMESIWHTSNEATIDALSKKLQTIS